MQSSPLKDSSLVTQGFSERDPAFLLVSIFIVAGCALTYELVISTVASYFLGSSVLHFSVTIGLFMFFLGLGAFFSKFITQDELSVLILTESLLGLVGGLSVVLLQLAFTFSDYFYLMAFLVTAAIGLLCGLEIPLLTRILNRFQGLKETLAHALSFDYVGGLVASLLFPLVLLPVFGTTKTALLVGMVNLTVAGILTWKFRVNLRKAAKIAWLTILGFVILLLMFVLAERWLSAFESALYDDEIVYAEQSPYQRIILTKFAEDLRLYLNGDLQFSTVDEYRYHETLVHVPMQMAQNPRSVLIFGGGDGFAVREVLKYSSVNKIVVVDLDKSITDLARSHPLLQKANHKSLEDARVTIVNDDAWNYVRSTTNKFDVVISDLPDPNDYNVGKLYTVEFYRSLKAVLEAGGVMITQAGSPYFAREAFWCLTNTLKATFEKVVPMQNFVPSFGQWGYVVAFVNGHQEISELRKDVATRYLTDPVLKTLNVFDNDTSEVETGVNKLENQLLVKLTAKGWSSWQ